MKKIGKAYMETSTDKDGKQFTRVVRGPFSEKDRHWGARSSRKFREILDREGK